VCGGQTFKYHPVLWKSLIEEWELNEDEIEYINYQQGYCCESCGSNIRTMSLAKAIMNTYDQKKSSLIFTDFIRTRIFKKLRILEINETGLHSYLVKNTDSKLSSFFNLSQYKYIEYPEYDMTHLNLESESYDLIIHSDTLEHVNNPLKALKEILRVLSSTGKTIFTVPIILNKLSRSRDKLKPSYHGSENEHKYDYKVYTEFGSDIWTYLLNAGFSKCSIYNFFSPAGIAIMGEK
jgi:SAM-dependent methyltransferase